MPTVAAVRQTTVIGARVVAVLVASTGRHRVGVAAATPGDYSLVERTGVYATILQVEAVQTELPGLVVERREPLHVDDLLPGLGALRNNKLGVLVVRGVAHGGVCRVAVAVVVPSSQSKEL